MRSVSSGYDYIVVGAGTAGCVLAARLSENDDVRVLLLEAGGRDPLEAMAVPAAWPTLLGGPADWGDTTVIQSSTGAAISVPRGRGLGGSSAINGLNFLRGHRSSYDAWPGRGAGGWGFEDLLPFLRRSERAEGREASVRGMDGPLTVGPPAQPNPVAEAFLDAAVEVGHQRAGDISSGLETGFGWCDNNIAGGVRQSAADAYLRPIMDRRNLDVVTEALVHRLRVTGGRCRGVQYTKRGAAVSVECTEEVMLTAGTIGSAQLLLLSGIGPKDHLRDVGVDLVLDLPGVGANLQDHPLSTIVYSARRQIPSITGGPPAEAFGLIRSDPALDAPDLQILCADLPYHARSLPGPDSGYSIGFSAMTPRSRGSVRLAGANVTVAPLIDPNYLGDECDLTTLAAGLRLARQIGQAEALVSWRGEEVLPGPGVHDFGAVRAYLGRSLLCYFHYAGTCRIGSDDLAVVDTDLRVWGITGLRVADASVMPSLVSANTNATVYGIAERAADLLTRPSPA
jgi:choline dehydrogenase